MSYTYVNVKSCLYTTIALLTLAIVAVFSRIALRARTARKAVDIAWGKHLDDLFCLLALVPTIGVSVVLIYGMSESEHSIASILTRVPGAKKGIVGNHNDPTNIEGWIMDTTPTLVILEKVSPPASNASCISSNKLLVGLYYLHHAAPCPRLDQTCLSLLLPSHFRDKRLPMDFACLRHSNYWLHTCFLHWLRF